MAFQYDLRKLNMTMTDTTTATTVVTMTDTTTMTATWLRMGHEKEQMT